MSLELVRVERPRPGDAPPVNSDRLRHAGQVALDIVRRRPALALLAAPVALLEAPALAIGAAAAAAAIAIGGEEFYIHRKDKDRQQSPEYREILVLTPDDVVGQVDIKNQPLLPGVVYIRHPKASRRHVLIRSTDFHRTILDEQLAEIIAYLRMNLKVSSVTIYARSEKSGKMVVGGRLNRIPLGASIFGRKVDQYAMRMNSRSQKKTRKGQDLIWIDDFSKVKALAYDAHDGDFEIYESTDISFGLSAEAAKIASINAEWISKFELTIKAEFA